jgi:hypothetical protein
MDNESIKLLSAIVSMILGVLGLIWNVLKDWEKVPPNAKKFFDIVFKQGLLAWFILITIGLVLIFPRFSFGKTEAPPILNTSRSYTFENIDQIPVNIKGVNNAKSIELADEQHYANSKNSLRIDMNLPIWQGGEDCAGVFIDFKGIEQVDAVSTYIFIPKRSDTNSGGFSLYFSAVDGKGRTIWSGNQEIKIGEWTPQFWGTRYAHSDRVICYDENSDGICDGESFSYWNQWTDTKITGIFVQITRDGESYQGPVYLDNITTYRVSNNP